MRKEANEIEMNYPPAAKVDVWDFGRWLEAIVAERVTTETMMGNRRVEWTLKLRGNGFYAVVMSVTDPMHLRLRMEGADGVSNRKLLETFERNRRILA